MSGSKRYGYTLFLESIFTGVRQKTFLITRNTPLFKTVTELGPMDVNLIYTFSELCRMYLSHELHCFPMS